MSTTIDIDGSEGEGGGQILRSALALSVHCQVPVRLHNVRSRRRKPGLMRQHLTAVHAARRISAAHVEGDVIGSQTLSFRPTTLLPGAHTFAIGSAGSTTLVLQTVLWPLLLAGKPSKLVLEGGTHNPLAPPLDFMARSLVPLLRQMGANIELNLDRHGFAPAGGGRVLASVTPSPKLQPLSLLQRGVARGHRAQVLLSKLPAHIAERELRVVHERLGWKDLETRVVEADGPGNVLLLEAEHEATTTVVTGFGESGTRAERVAERAVHELEKFLAANVPVDEHLADQLLIPLALAGGGEFRTLQPTEHTRTHARIIERFLPVRVEIHGDGEAWRVVVSAR